MKPAETNKLFLNNQKQRLFQSNKVCHFRYVIVHPLYGEACQG